MSALLTKAFEKWVAECTASNLPARPDAIVFALMEREPSRDDTIIPPEKITHRVNNLHYGKLDQNSIVCSAIVADNENFNYDWIRLVHQASNTLCGVISGPVRHKHTGETIIRNFAIIFSGLPQIAHITTPPQSWQVDFFSELNNKAPLESPSFSGAPTTPTPPNDAAGLEIVNAKFVRMLIAEAMAPQEKPALPPETPKPALQISRVLLQSGEQTRGPLTINRKFVQSGRTIHEPITINNIQLQTGRLMSEPVTVNRGLFVPAYQTNEPLTVARAVLQFAVLSAA